MATEAEVQALRNQIGRLIGEKVQLQNRVIELERERSEMSIEGLAAAGVRSIRSAEEAMATEVPGTNFRVPELEITVRGYVIANEGAVLLRVPRPELQVPPEHLGTIRLLAAEIPPATATAAKAEPRDPRDPPKPQAPPKTPLIPTARAVSTKPAAPPRTPKPPTKRSKGPSGEK